MDNKLDYYSQIYLSIEILSYRYCMKMLLLAPFSITNLILIGLPIFIHCLFLFYSKLVVIIRPCESVIFFSPIQIVFVPSVPLLQAEFLLITSVFVPLLLQLEPLRQILLMHCVQCRRWTKYIDGEALATN